MKNLFKKNYFLLLLIPFLALSSCDEEEVPVLPMPTGTENTFTLGSVAVPGISGTATFIENDDNSVTIELALSGTPAGGMHPAHIHVNTAAEGGGIALTLGTVTGGVGTSTITTTQLDDGTPITYDDLLDFDGYINVHLSSSELGTIVAQGDIGQNVLTNETKEYALGSVAVPNISGTATFTKRLNGEALATIQLQNTPAEGSHPGHIHINTAAEGGGIAFSFNPVDGTTGMSKTNVAALDDGTAFGYDDVLGFDGYINIHLSADNLATIVAQGDIGQNELTSTSKEYILGSVAVPSISGTATFTERVNGEALATIQLQNTPADGSHPGHIHLNTAAEGGGIAFSFNPVNGTTGMSKTNVAALDDGTPFLYENVLDFDGYINIHLSADELQTIVAQGDIGQNELTSTVKQYALGSVAVPGILGTATFAERVNGEALATIQLQNTPADGSHPGHIHINTAAEGGGIAFTFNPVNGATGMSKTNVAALDDGTAFGYNELLGFDGYINIHLSAENLATIVAQGDIGQNELTGEAKTYNLGSVAVPEISGTALFEKRNNGEALATIQLQNTPDGGSHPGHIHINTAAEGGGIAFSFNPVNGTTGMSKTNVAALDNGTAFGYDDVLGFDGYINIHLAADNLATLVAQGDIGQNELTGDNIAYVLNTKDVDGISGTATLAKRLNGETLLTLTLTGTPDGGSHPAHIHMNSAAEGGGIAVSLSPVNGTTGMSKTQITKFDDDTAVSYDELLVYDGYINVHLSAEQLATIVAQGDIGSNVN